VGVRLSIIIPVYNVAQYVGCGIKSIGNVDPDEVEIIAVDDGYTYLNNLRKRF